MNIHVVEKTQKLLGTLIEKQPLDSELLNKPPFKFLQAIIKELDDKYHVFKGVYTPSDYDANKKMTKSDKISFLKILIDFTNKECHINLKANAYKMVAGLEPELTNELLQKLASLIHNRKNVTKVRGLLIKKTISSKPKGNETDKPSSRLEATVLKPIKVEPPDSIVMSKDIIIDRQTNKNGSEIKVIADVTDDIREKRQLQNQSSVNKDDYKTGIDDLTKQSSQVNENLTTAFLTHIPAPHEKIKLVAQNESQETFDEYLLKLTNQINLVDKNNFLDDNTLTAQAFNDTMDKVMHYNWTELHVNINKVLKEKELLQGELKDWESKRRQIEEMVKAKQADKNETEFIFDDVEIANRYEEILKEIKDEYANHNEMRARQFLYDIKNN